MVSMRILFATVASVSATEKVFAKFNWQFLKKAIPQHHNERPVVQGQHVGHPKDIAAAGMKGGQKEIPAGLEEKILYHARGITADDAKSISNMQKAVAKNGWCLENLHFGEKHDQNGFVLYSCRDPQGVTNFKMNFDTSYELPGSSVLHSAPSTQINRVMFVVGGNAMIASDFIPLFANYAEKNKDQNQDQAFFFADLPGYSGKGTPSPNSALNVDVSATYQLRKVFGNDNLKFNFVGHSLGCAVVTQIAAHPDVHTDRVILSAPFQDTVVMAKSIFPTFPYSMLNHMVHHKWNNTEQMVHMNPEARLTIIHSKADTIVPFAQGNALKNIARRHGVRVKLEALPWGGHNEVFMQHMPVLMNALNDMDEKNWQDPELRIPTVKIRRNKQQAHKKMRTHGGRKKRMQELTHTKQKITV